MKFKTLKIVSKSILSLALAGYLGAAACQRFLGGQYAQLCAYAATALLIAGVGIRFIWAKCPHCGRYISRKHFNDKQCCYCGKNLLE